MGDRHFHRQSPSPITNAPTTKWNQERDENVSNLTQQREVKFGGNVTGWDEIDAAVAGDRKKIQ